MNERGKEREKERGKEGKKEREKERERKNEGKNIVYLELFTLSKRRGFSYSQTMSS